MDDVSYRPQLRAGGLLLSAPSSLSGGRYNLTLWDLAPNAPTGGGGRLEFDYYATLDKGATGRRRQIFDASAASLFTPPRL